MTVAPDTWERAWTIHAMAMPFTVRLRGRVDPAVADVAVSAFAGSLHDAEEIFSLWSPRSPMSLVARGVRAIEDAPAEIREVLGLAESWRGRTGGAFDPRLRRRAAERLPVRYPDGAPDPTGIVKTWAVARALPLLEDVGAAAWMVDAAGDLCVGGDARWTVGVVDPSHVGDPAGSRPVETVTLGGRWSAMATSGLAQARDHVWDPVTGAPARHYAQVTVVGEDLVACDAWATAIVAGGPHTLALAADEDLAVLAIVGARAQGGFDAVATRAWEDVHE